MLETIFSILCACIAIFVAGLLVIRQNKCSENTEALKQEVEKGLEDIALEVSALTREEPSECTLLYLEKRMSTFNKVICIVQTPTYKRRTKSVKRKKNFADD